MDILFHTTISHQFSQLCEHYHFKVFMESEFKKPDIQIDSVDIRLFVCLIHVVLAAID